MPQLYFLKNWPLKTSKILKKIHFSIQWTNLFVFLSKYLFIILNGSSKKLRLTGIKNLKRILLEFLTWAATARPSSSSSSRRPSSRRPTRASRRRRRFGDARCRRSTCRLHGVGSPSNHPKSGSFSHIFKSGWNRGAVGRSVASSTRGPWFESRY